MTNISQNVNIEMLEKLVDGTYKKKNPVTRITAITDLQLNTDGKLEYFDGLEWQKIRGDGYPVGNITNFEAKGDDTTVELTWQDPPNVTITDSLGNLITIARWKGTKILRKPKVNGYPQNENDGILVVDNGVRNQYESTPFTDTGLVNDTDYYYMAFPYTEEDVFTVDEANRVVGTPSDVDDKTDAPGPKNLISGTMALGFFGEVPAAELITGNNLASQTGITQGSAQFSDTPWLKFASEGKILFVAKKSIRSTISWDAINTAKCVYGDEGDKVIMQNGHSYKVRLLKGANPAFNPKAPINGQSSGGDGYSKEVNHYSEWNKLMCAIHTEAPTKAWVYPMNVEATLEVLTHDLGSGANGMYTDQDLHTHKTHGDGTYCWCQEMTTSTSDRLGRGYPGVSYASDSTSSNTNAVRGWRPVLEFVA